PFCRWCATRTPANGRRVTRCNFVGAALGPRFAPEPALLRVAREFNVNELQRQAWLDAFGLTPWVATQPLPGAAPSALLDWPEASAPALSSQGHVATQDPTHADGVASMPHASPAADARSDLPRSNVPHSHGAHHNAPREHAADNVAGANFVAADSAAAQDAAAAQPPRARATRPAPPLPPPPHPRRNGWLLPEHG